jgi:Flp pilus assembly protein TadD
MNSLVSLYNRYTKEKKLIKTKSGEDLTTIIPLIARVDPRHYLLRDSALAHQYLAEAEKLIANSDFEEATRYIETGLSLFPDNSRLKSLYKQINAQNRN